MNRRSFFQGLTRTVAIVALAPQLAFRTKPNWDLLPGGEVKKLAAYWSEDRVVAYMPFPFYITEMPIVASARKLEGTWTAETDQELECFYYKEPWWKRLFGL